MKKLLKKILNRYYFKKIDLSFKANFSPKKQNFWIGRLRWLFYSIRGEITAVGIVIGGIIGTISWSTVATIAVTALSVGYSLWSSSNKKKPRISAENNGHLINSRESSDPVKIAYGVCRVGGTWVFYV